MLRPPRGPKEGLAGRDGASENRPYPLLVALVEDKGEQPSYEQRVQSLLADAVRDELGTYNGVLGLGLPTEALDNLGWAVAARLGSAFDFRWSPDWAGSGPHVWSEADGVRARCSTCLEDSPPQPDEDSARRWHGDHVASHHDG